MSIVVDYSSLIEIDEYYILFELLLNAKSKSKTFIIELIDIFNSIKSKVLLIKGGNIMNFFQPTGNFFNYFWTSIKKKYCNGNPPAPAAGYKPEFPKEIGDFIEKTRNEKPEPTLPKFTDELLVGKPIQKLSPLRSIYLLLGMFAGIDYLLIYSKQVIQIEIAETFNILGLNYKIMFRDLKRESGIDLEESLLLLN